MDNVNWSSITYFSKNENWGDISKVSLNLILKLNRMRHKIKCPIYISPVKGAVYATTGHAPKSYHYKGKAADIFPSCDLFDAFIAAIQVGFTGIGLYPYWGMYEPIIILGGLHVDIRPGPLKTWVRMKDNSYVRVEYAVRTGAFSKPGK